MDINNIQITAQDVNLILFAWFIGVTALTYLRFWWDKQCAIHNVWRVPESQLLFLAAIGGILGAKLAQRLFRHKTRKQPFARKLNMILGAWIIGIAILAFDGLGLIQIEPALEALRQKLERAAPDGAAL